MLGTLDLRDRRVTVVGAGIAGLLLARELDRRGFEVTLLEASSRAGGLIETLETELGPVERAAHSLPATGPVRALCEELGVTLVPLRSGSRAKFIFRRGKARRFPLSAREAALALGRAYFVLSDRAASAGEATLQRWAERHLGEAALDALVAPLVTGIYAASPGEIAVGAAFPSLEIPPGHSLLSFQLGRACRRVFRREPGRGEIVAPERGMGSLVGALESELARRLGSRFRKGEAVTALPASGNIALCVPAREAAGLVQAEDPELASRLRAVPYSPLVSATLFVPRELFPHPPQGLGVLVAPSEKRAALGVLFNSSCFPGRALDEGRWVSLTLMLGGSGRPELGSCDEAEIERIARVELRALFSSEGPKHRPDGDATRYRYNDPRIRIFAKPVARAIPQYGAPLLEAWRAARSGWCREQGRVLFASYTGQVSLRGMIQEADALGKSLAAGLQIP